jgi:uncharacterized membrane protein
VYLDWLRGVAVVAMVLAHVTDSWTGDADRASQPFYVVVFIAGIASPLFLFLAGVATAMSAASKARREGGHAIGARMARRRGWEIFVLGLVFRLQAQLLGMGPLTNMLKVDMLNIMGLSMVAASYLWQTSERARTRVAVFALVAGGTAMLTPIVRDAAWLAVLPDPLEAYLRPAGPYAAFTIFPWAAFLFAGVIVGDLVDALRQAPARQVLLQNGLAIAGGAGVTLAWFASFQPSIYESSSFWHDSPTFFFIRLGLVTLLVPLSWVLEQLLPARVMQPLATMGRSSLFVYWIHIEMVYGVIAEPIKRTMPLWMSLAGTALLSLVLYGIVRWKNDLLGRHELRGPWRVLAPVVR